MYYGPRKGVHNSWLLQLLRALMLYQSLYAIFYTDHQITPLLVISKLSQCSTVVRNTVLRAMMVVNGKHLILGSPSSLTPPFNRHEI